MLGFILQRHWKVLGARAALALWLAATTIVGATLLGGHLIALPTSAAPVQPALAAVAAQRPGASLAVAHVLAAECGCSRLLLDHLVARGVRTGIAERVVVIGRLPEADRARVLAAGFQYEELDAPAALAAYGAEAVPLLLVGDPAGVVKYAGGYGARKRTASPEDTRVLDAVARGETVAPLPIFGCAVTRELQATLDPIGVRR